jgi:hypothetical protein
MLEFLGHIHALAGDTAEAWRMLAELEGLVAEGRIDVLHLVYPCIALGEKDRAFEILEKAYEERSGQLVYLKVEPSFDSLRDDSRFDGLLQRMGLGAAVRQRPMRF